MNRCRHNRRPAHPAWILARWIVPGVCLLLILVASCAHRRSGRRAIAPPAMTTSIYTFVFPNPEWTGFVPVRRSEILGGTDIAQLNILLLITNPLQTRFISNQWRGYAITNAVTNISSAPSFYFTRRDYDWSGRLIQYKPQ